MAAITIRACQRCHAKKIKCDGAPDCLACRNAKAQCEPYMRARRGENIEAFKQARRRVQWLESELFRLVNIDCKNIPTGTALQSVENTIATLDRRDIHNAEQDMSTPSHVSDIQGAMDRSPLNNDAPEISLLALNATGEMRYLGPSSGAFFATYATSLARSFNSYQGTGSALSLRSTRTRSHGRVSLNDDQTLPLETVRLLLSSYQMWVQPLYPLLDQVYLEALVTRCSNIVSSNSSPGTDLNSEMTIFYLVMALGATNLSNTMKQTQTQVEDVTDGGHQPSPTYLYSMALKFLDRNADLRPSILTIQIILLISIYSSYGSIGSSQWQLAGLAMRMAIEIGLHYSPQSWQITSQEIDRRNRVFWTAYAIEISLAYNLGRPPSISEEHITANLPSITPETALAIHHIKHRQIQSRIVAQVYSATKRTRTMTADEKLSLITNLQAELDDWKSALPGLKEAIVASAYPYSYWERLYHGTSFVLHRSSPLCPQPSVQSLEQCIRSAGAYIDNVLMVLRNSNVPLSWMLVQGVLFAGLTMLITARTGAQILTVQTGGAFLLVEFPAWTRKCSICLAIMNERWAEDLLAKLESQFEDLTNETLLTISTSLTSQGANAATTQANTPFTTRPYPTLEIGGATGSTQQESTLDGTAYIDSTMNGDWGGLESFREFLGFESAQTFWDVFPTELDIGIPDSMPWNT